MAILDPLTLEITFLERGAEAYVVTFGQRTWMRTTELEAATTATAGR